MNNLRPENHESYIIDRSNTILSNLKLSWEDIQGKNVLDAGSGGSELSKAASLIGSTAQVISMDVKFQENWIGFPWKESQLNIVGDAYHIPVNYELFDYVIYHGSLAVDAIHEGIRVLKPGGEIRIYPIGGLNLEFWYVGQYLHDVKGLSVEEINQRLQKYDEEMQNSDGWVPNEYINLREEALNTLTQQQKLNALDNLVQMYSQALKLRFTYILTDPTAREPNGVLVYKKKLLNLI